MLHFGQLYQGEFFKCSKSGWLHCFIRKYFIALQIYRLQLRLRGWDQSIMEVADAVLPIISFRITHCCCNI